MLIHGVMMSYNPNTKVAKQGGGTYDAWELVYRNTNNEVKTVAKPVQGLKFNKSLANQLAALQSGDEFTLLQEKKGQFWEVQSVEKGFKEVQDEVAAKPDGNRAPVREGKVTGSNYETPEERAKKQVVIVRQGVLNAAIEFLKLRIVNETSVIPSSDEVIKQAKEFEKYVYKDMPKLAKQYLDETLKEVSE